MLPHSEEKLQFGQYLPSAIKTPATMEYQSRVSRLFWYAYINFIVRYQRMTLLLIKRFNHSQVVQSEMRVCTQPLLRSSRSIRWQYRNTNRSSYPITMRWNLTRTPWTTANRRRHVHPSMTHATIKSVRWLNAHQPKRIHIVPPNLYTTKSTKFASQSVAPTK